MGDERAADAIVVQCHPVPDSLSASLRDAVVRGLRGAGRTVDEYHLGEGASPPSRIVGDLHLVFPTWWGGLPSALLGWIQSELGPWIDEGRRDPSPWASVTSLTAWTTYGSGPLLNRLQGEPGRRLVERTLVRHCGPRATVAWNAIYRQDGMDDTELGRRLAAIEDRLTSGRATA